MKNYLDPVYLVVNDATWKSRIYTHIFDCLNHNINYIEEVEKQSDALYKIIRFKFSEELFSEIYNHNPFKNDPSIEKFYLNVFSKVLSDLSRRFDWCPTKCEISENIADIICCESDYIPEKVASEFGKLISQCVSCNYKNSLIAFISPINYETQIKINTDRLTDFEILKTNNVYQLFEVSIFLNKGILSENSIRIAIDIFYRQSVISGRIASEQHPQEYIFDNNFFRTLETAKLTQEDNQYKQKFIDSLTQIIYSYDIDIRLHKYGKILINKKKYDKYSADVFQMGRGTNDRRCSRIFFCKINNQICLYEYDPDFHAGE
jgi:hypothetical protein